MKAFFFLSLFLFVALPIGFADSVEPESSAEVQPAVAAEIERIHELRREIRHHDDLYFRLAAPEISDFEYDQLKAELQRLEAKSPDIGSEIPPVDPVGNDHLDGFETYPHQVSMLSLDKALSDEDLLNFHRRMAEALGRGEEITYWVEPKFDGIAISLVYEHGRLVRAVTRGDGSEGDDVTANVRAIADVPDRLRAGAEIPEFVEIRGEIFLTFREFQRINESRSEAGEPLFANPRNLAAGTVKLHDPAEVAERRLSLVCFGWGGWSPTRGQPGTLAEFRERLAAWGLPTVERAKAVRGWEAMRAAVNDLGRRRNSLPFPIDGAVIKLASVAEQELLGIGPGAPRWAVARKFAPARATTRLLGITLQVGRTGVMTPVAELAPVELAGSTVARATLHNADEIARLDLRVGDSVYVEKAGAVIPAIVGVDPERRPAGSQPYAFPEDCPACGSLLVREEGEAAYFCRNELCLPQVERQLEHFASVMEIRGLGPATVAALVEAGVRSPVGLYQLDREDLLSLDGIGERSAENLLRAIEASREAELEEVLFALGVPGIGKERAASVARAFPNLRMLQVPRVEKLTASEASGGADLGVEAAAALLAKLETEATRELFAELELANVQVTEALGEGAFSGEVIALTGRLTRWTRGEVTEVLIEQGAEVRSDVSGKTTLLVVGERPGSKLDRAKKLGVKVIGEEELARRLDF